MLYLFYTLPHPRPQHKKPIARNFFRGMLCGMKNERAEKIIQLVGSDTIVDRVGVTRHSVIQARRLGLPARWFIIMQSICTEKGVPCDPRAFRFKFEDEKV